MLAQLSVQADRRGRIWFIPIIAGRRRLNTALGVMDFAVALFAVALAPGAVAVVVTLFLLGRLSQPWYFFLVAVLVMYGAYSMSQEVLETVSASGNFLEAGPITEEVLAKQAVLYLKSRVPALFVACLVGIPTLISLSKRLSRR